MAIGPRAERAQARLTFVEVQDLVELEAAENEKPEAGFSLELHNLPRVAHSKQ